MTQEQFEALGIEKSLAKKAAEESKKELENYVAKETFDAIVAVAAGVVCHYIIKWLDGGK